MKNNKKAITIRSSAAEYLTYAAAVGDSSESIEMRYENENIWLTQRMMAELYNVDVRTVNFHIKNIYSDAELAESSTIRKYRIVQSEGGRSAVEALIDSEYKRYKEQETLCDPDHYTIVLRMAKKKSEN